MGADPNVADTSLTCINCGYNLSGTPVGGNCPECGRAVVESLTRLRDAGGGTIRRESKWPSLSRTIGLCAVSLVSGPFSFAIHSHARRIHDSRRIDAQQLKVVEASVVLVVIIFVIGILFIIGLASG